MRTNKILGKMRAGEKAYGCSSIFPSADIIELLGMAGFDYVFLDGESYSNHSINACSTR